MDYLIMSALVLGLYFLPALVASSLRHRHSVVIFFFNLLLGWTVLCWLIALVWAFVGEKTEAVTRATHVRCPDCRELVYAEARVCKHCGCRLIPQSEVKERGLDPGRADG